MIKYTPLLKTMKSKGISTYRLINEYKISSSTIHRIRHNLPLSTTSINDLCNILECKIEDVLIHIPDDKNTLQWINQRNHDS